MTAAITGLILSGGLGSRMGGVDKGLQPFRDEPMVAHVVRRLRPQVASLLINANQTIERYADFGFPVVSDDIAGYAGPLAGMHAGLAICETPLLATAPCDSPFLPDDLVRRLHEALDRADADLAVPVVDGRAHPVFCLMRRHLLPGLTQFLAHGDRKVGLWHASLKLAKVPFDDQPDAFANINTLDELSALSRQPDAS